MQLKLAGFTLGAVLLLVGCSPAPGEQSTQSRNGPDAALLQAQEWRDVAWQGVLDQFPDAERPDVTIEKLLPPAEQFSAQVQCLRAEGYEVRVDTENFGFEVFGPPEQEEAYAIALYSCQTRFAIDPRTVNGDDTDAQLAERYREETQTLVPCLEENGLTVSDIPSLGTYIDRFRDGNPWSAWVQLAETQAPETIAKLVEACGADS